MIANSRPVYAPKDITLDLKSKFESAETVLKRYRDGYIYPDEKAEAESTVLMLIKEYESLASQFKYDPNLYMARLKCFSALGMHKEALKLSMHCKRIGVTVPSVPSYFWDQRIADEHINLGNFQQAKYILDILIEQHGIQEKNIAFLKIKYLISTESIADARYTLMEYGEISNNDIQKTLTWIHCEEDRLYIKKALELRAKEKHDEDLALFETLIKKVVSKSHDFRAESKYQQSLTMLEPVRNALWIKDEALELEYIECLLAQKRYEPAYMASLSLLRSGNWKNPDVLGIHIRTRNHLKPSFFVE